MKLKVDLWKRKTVPPTAAFKALCVTLAALWVLERAEANPNVVLWDTMAAPANMAQIESRDGWKAVPSDLLTLEKDPPKASSDPGYYGREYVFKGDAVVENRLLAAKFSSAEGRVIIYAKDLAGGTAGAALGAGASGKRILEFAPVLERQSATIRGVQVLRNTEDEVALGITFSTSGGAECGGEFIVDRSGIVEIRPSKGLSKTRLLGAIECGIVPDFIGDDLIFRAADQAGAKAICLPAENMFIGLLKGEASEVVMTWPKGKQQLTLQAGSEEPGKPAFGSFDFDNDGQSFYVAVLSAPGVWHKETLGPAFLEKDVASQWQRPFPAKWKTQLSEAGVTTTFAFRDAKGQIWRGVPGSYNYPVWFDGEKAWFHLSKKVPSQGEAMVYFLEGRGTPPEIPTPADILKATLGRSASEPILDLEGRRLRTHHRRGGEGVRRACTCGCTEAIQAVFESGEEVAQKDYVKEALDDMVYFVRRHVERIDQYQRFAEDLSKFLQAQSNSSPELKPFLDEVAQIAQQIPQEYAVQKENMKSLAHADTLVRQTMALTERKDANNLKAYMDLLKAWRDMGGAQDYVLAQCHTITRKVCQAAGYGCVNQPRAVAVAEEIRARCRQCLRNPDGYEIWADY